MATSIFSTYSQGENRVTSSIIQVLRNLPINVVERFLEMFASSENYSSSDRQTFLQFKNQVKGEGSVPDAEISANFSLLFETKIERSAINPVQLASHLEMAKKREAVLVYLTPDYSQPEILKGKELVWKSFQDVFDLITELLADPMLILSERDQFLLRNLQDFFSEEKGLLPIADEVLIVAASVAWPAYQMHGVYVCQAGRSFKAIKLLGFYADGCVQPKVAKILTDPNDFLFPEHGDVLDHPASEKLTGWLRENQWARGQRLLVFDLSKIEGEDTVELDGPISNDLISKSGRTSAYTQGQRYTTLGELRKAKTTSDLVKS